jgi:HEAT repeat protein
LIVLGEDVVPTLIESLRDPDPQVRLDAARDMVIIARHAKSAVPLLIDTLRNEPDKDIRKQGAIVLGLIGRDAKEAIPILPWKPSMIRTPTSARKQRRP